MGGGNGAASACGEDFADGFGFGNGGLLPGGAAAVRLGVAGLAAAGFFAAAGGNARCGKRSGGGGSRPPSPPRSGATMSRGSPSGDGAAPAGGGCEPTGGGGGAEATEDGGPDCR